MASVVRAVGCSEAGGSVGLTTIKSDSNRSNIPPCSRREKFDLCRGRDAGQFFSANPGGHKIVNRSLRYALSTEVGCTVAAAIEYRVLVLFIAQPEKQMSVVAT